MLSVVMFCATLTVIDGDTVRCDGQKLRLLGQGIVDVRGIDTPELRTWKCEKERRLARLARARLKQLLAGEEVRIVAEGFDKTPDKRPLVNIYLSDGREIGSILLKEGFAREWRPHHKANWCD